MKFQYLREFVVAARSHEMQAAAAELGISLSALSKHINAIEMELGVNLFVRSRHTVLSQYGRIMLPYAQELIALQNDYNADFSKDSAKKSDVLTIGLSSIQFKERSSRLLESFMLSNPSLPVETVEASNSQLEDMILAEKCDMAFIRSLPSHIRNPELAYFPFCADSLVAFLPLSHPLASAESLSFEDIKNETIFLRTENSAICRLCKSKFEELGISPAISYAGSYATYDAIRKGEGISLFFARPTEEEIDKNIRIVPIAPAIHSLVDIVYRRSVLTRKQLTFLQYALSNPQV